MADVPAPEFVRGVGTGDQQPMGAATQENQLSQVAEQVAPAGMAQPAGGTQPEQGGRAPAQPTGPPGTAGAPSAQLAAPQPFRPANDIEAFLAAAPPAPAPVPFSNLNVAVPSKIDVLLPALRSAAFAPDADPATQALFAALSHLALMAQA